MREYFNHIPEEKLNQIDKDLKLNYFLIDFNNQHNSWEVICAYSWVYYKLGRFPENQEMAIHQDALQYLNEWNVFKNRGLHFIHLNINSLLPKIEELRYIAKSTNAAVIGICESKLDASVLDPEISIDNYKILRCDRNRQGGGVACYVRNDLSYNTLSVFPREVENIFFEILLPNSKPITVGTIYLPPQIKVIFWKY